MKIVRFALAFTVVSLLALSVTANAKSKQPAKFYDFGEQIIDGQILEPKVERENVKQRVKHDRLLELKKSFLPKILESSRHASLK